MKSGGTRWFFSYRHREPPRGAWRSSRSWDCFVATRLAMTTQDESSCAHQALAGAGGGCDRGDRNGYARAIRAAHLRRHMHADQEQALGHDRQQGRSGIPVNRVAPVAKQPRCRPRELNPAPLVEGEDMRLVLAVADLGELVGGKARRRQRKDAGGVADTSLTAQAGPVALAGASPPPFGRT